MVTTLRTDLECPFELVSDIDVTAFLALVPCILWDFQALSSRCARSTILPKPSHTVA